MSGDPAAAEDEDTDALPPWEAWRRGLKRFTTGVWRRLELYGEIDTNRRDGLIEWYVDGVRQQSWEALDLGGWVGSRGLYRGKSAPAGASSATASAGDGALSADCDPAYRSYGGFRLVGPAMRTMGGGYSLDPTLVPENDCWHLLYNLRWYGR